MAPQSLQYGTDVPPAGYGGWIPTSPAIIDAFIKKHIGLAARRGSGYNLSPPVEEFQQAIKNDPVMFDLCGQMILQAKTWGSEINSFDQLICIIDGIVTSPPAFQSTGTEDTQPIGVPLYLILDLLSNTSAGYDLFRKPEFNKAMKALLDSWGSYLTTPDSGKTLNETDEGWFSGAALARLQSEGRGVFNNTYVCPDPQATNRGYETWDAFFTREVQRQARPIGGPPQNSFITNACESEVYRITYDVQAHDLFWLKFQNYSLYDMLNRDELYENFVGGTVYQAFLSPLDYHRWHAPVDGVVKKVVLVPGTYYAGLPDDGAPVNDPELEHHDPRGALIRSQAWLTISATRALIFIEANNTNIGLMCLIAVGMAEVSTCKVTIKEGDQVRRGDQLGMFRFGGSSHTLIFQKGAGVRFRTYDDNDQEVDVKVGMHLKVNQMVGYAAGRPQ
ncbi:phosphatidylserine decarboxylase [Moniliophthora roreri MCA 2997]|uniref:Phosphatidylserine decarboxylase n=2 Tax=Moniliophthora roreri TaxID=221103 RepID=V2XB66_MONRO|nr:phosphatidylserine decarboxylase [Moniliophthora roreri MCA 2997]KAI3608936.1 phosphatidylserine decarboxylase [Moniliophthora roreri]